MAGSWHVYHGNSIWVKRNRAVILCGIFNIITTSTLRVKLFVAEEKPPFPSYITSQLSCGVIRRWFPLYPEQIRQQCSAHRSHARKSGLVYLILLNNIYHATFFLCHLYIPSPQVLSSTHVHVHTCVFSTYMCRSEDNLLELVLSLHLVDLED